KHDNTVHLICASQSYLFINCRPFYSPREFASFILAAVYISPDADVREAQRTLADCIQQVERTYPDALVIVLGDFNQSNLRYELPRYKQFIKCPTRAENTLDHCYTTVKDAYRAIPRAALGLSDHVMVHLIPTYRQKLKQTKPSVSTTKRWTSEAVEELRTCLDTTDWDMFKGATHDLDEYTDTVTSYIHFCEERILPTRTRVSYSNDKPWFTPRLRQIRKEKEAALKSGDRDCYREAKYQFSKELRRAKSVYSEKLQQQFTANDSASVWRGLRQITDYRPQASKGQDDKALCQSLSLHYARFDTSSAMPNTSPPPSAVHQSVKLIKFADDTTLIGLISNGDETAYRRDVARLVSWCGHNNLQLNAQKTVEMIVDFRKVTAPLPPLALMDSPITIADSFRFLGTTITRDQPSAPSSRRPSKGCSSYGS
ncbi:hypothetical protein D4764_03G0004480, partial [Takifugu flavidus]